MNSKLIYIPVSVTVLVAIALIALEVPYYGLMVGFLKLLLLAIVLGVGIAAALYTCWARFLAGEDRYVATGSSLLFSFVVCLGALSTANRYYAYGNCSEETMPVLHYEPRYAVGYGNIDKGPVEPNQFVITINDRGISRSFTLRQALQLDDVTNTVTFEFCTGILGTKYIRDQDL